MFEKSRYRSFIAYLCIKDIKYLMELFVSRQKEIEELWTQKSSVEKVLKRVRKPKYYEIPMKYLITLPVSVLKVVDAFFNQVDKFLFYLEFTVDMPTTFSVNYTKYLQNIKVEYELAIKALEKYSKD